MENQCRECHSFGTIFYDHNQGDLVCKGCGVVAEENYIDDTPEWTNFEDDGDSNSRASGTGKYQPFETATLSFHGTTKQAKQMAAIQKKLLESDTTNEGIKEIEEYCSKMELPNVIVEEAKDIYYKYENERKKKNSKRGKKKKDFILSVIFLASNKTGGGRTIKVAFSFLFLFFFFLFFF